MQKDNKIVLYQTSDKKVALPVNLKNDNIWLNRNQIATLFERDIKTIGKHINNAFKEEIDDLSVVVKFATTAAATFLYFLDKNDMLFENDIKRLEDYTLVA